MRKVNRLGTRITEYLDTNSEIKELVGLNLATFYKMKSFFCNESINLKPRQRIVNRYICCVRHGSMDSEGGYCQETQTWAERRTNALQERLRRKLSYLNMLHAIIVTARL